MIDPSRTTSAENLADLLGVTVRRISDLHREKILVQPAGKSGFLLRDGVRAYCARLREGAAARGATGTINAEREQLVRERTTRASQINPG